MLSDSSHILESMKYFSDEKIGRKMICLSCSCLRQPAGWHQCILYVIYNLHYMDFLFPLFLFGIICICLRYKDNHPPFPLHTRRLKSQHHEIMPTFPNSTPRYEFTLGGGVIPPRHSPSLRFIPLGFLHSGFLDFVFFLLMIPLPTPLLLFCS